MNREITMSNHFSKIAIPAAIAATIALSFGAALAQSQQTGTQPTQAQPGQSSGLNVRRLITTKSMTSRAKSPLIMWRLFI